MNNEKKTVDCIEELDKALSLDRIKEIQIEMLKTFDRFCRDNDITYFLSYGTLLGAIRHKGYIPWDDDVDVMVPRPLIEKLKKLYNVKDGKRFKIIDSDNDPNYDFPYPRMVDMLTFTKLGFNAQSYGVNIDIYPIDGFPSTLKEINQFRAKVRKIQRIRLFLMSLRNRLMKIVPIKQFPFINKLSNLQSKSQSSYDFETSRQVHVCSYYAQPYDKTIFEDKVEVMFEGRKFYAPIGWREFLTISYGDYMQLPPEDKRHPYHRNKNIYTR